MRAWLVLLYLALSACSNQAQRGPVAEPRLPPPDEHALCALAAGQAAGWRGLTPFDRARVPACFGARAETGTVTLHDRDWGVQHFVSAVAETWLYDDGTAVALISVFPSISHRIESLEEALGPAPWQRDVSFAERIERPALPPRTHYDGELVYAGRGLAVLIAASADGTRGVHRLRGFAPTEAAAYFRRFVQERPVEWQDP